MAKKIVRAFLNKLYTFKSFQPANIACLRCRLQSDQLHGMPMPFATDETKIIGYM